MTRAGVAAVLGLLAVSVVYAQQTDRGAALDPAAFAFRRAIPAGAAGPVALIMDAFALAHSRGPDEHFADVRILDSANRQVPYVIEHRDDPTAAPLTPERAEPPTGTRGTVKRPNWSTYRLRLPCANLPASQLAVETSARVFQRTVQVAVARQADRHSRTAWLDIMAQTTWGHVATDEEPVPPLTLSIVSGDASELWLSVDEGDNSALPITAVRLLLPSYRLRFYRPARSQLTLVYGRSDLLAPRYDLALVSRELLTADASVVTPLDERTPDTARPPLVSPARFWLLLSIAIVILLGLIVRLVTRPAAED